MSESGVLCVNDTDQIYPNDDGSDTFKNWKTIQEESQSMSFELMMVRASFFLLQAAKFSFPMHRIFIAIQLAHLDAVVCKC